jgi:hypothetical protein
MELKFKNGKTLFVHAHRLKYYFVPISSKTEFQEPLRHGILTSDPPPIIPVNENDRPNKANLERFLQIPEN